MQNSNAHPPGSRPLTSSGGPLTITFDAHHFDGMNVRVGGSHHLRESGGEAPDESAEFPLDHPTVTVRTIVSPETRRQQVAEIRHRGHAIEIVDQAGFGPMTTA